MPSADNAVVGVNDHTPALHAAVPLWVLAPVIATDTLALSPSPEPHEPPTVVTAAPLKYGNVRAVPLTEPTVTTGAVLSTVMLCGFEVPVLPAVSDCVTVTEYAPSAASAVVGVNDHALAEHAAEPFWVLAPVIATDTVGFTPAAVVHAPPNVDTVAFVTNGKVRAVPFTVVKVTVGAAVFSVIDCAPLEPVLPAVSDCVAVIA